LISAAVQRAIEAGRDRPAFNVSIFIQGLERQRVEWWNDVS
jgi:hypothetical protein